ncbi:MAG: methyltransferase domain-containing protein [Myxococcota bacterium]|nr:methyltransferase domain-containing protein [Myxococcales bacterium]
MSDDRDDKPWRARIEPLESEPRDLAAALAEIDVLLEIRAHREWVVEGLRAHVANVEGLLGEARERVDGLEGHTANLEDRLAQLERHAANLEGDRAGLEADRTELRAALAESERHVESLRLALEETRRHAAVVAKRLAQAEAQRAQGAAGAAGEPARLVPDEDVIRRQIDECREAHDEVGYYGAAEPGIDGQWRDLIWPAIERADFRSVLELAPGHGRNTAKLLEHAREIHLVDVNKSCIKACRKRFGDGTPSCRLHYHVNDGRSLAGIADASITFVYSWDAMVHFDKRVVREYVREFARVLAPGGTGFVHHSNFGTVSSSERWLENPSWRSNMTRELFADYCEEAGLEVVEQRLLDWFLEDLDCISTFRKPAR